MPYFLSFSLGPTNLTFGTVFPATTEIIPTVTDNAFNDGLISANEVAMFFRPTSTIGASDGELTFGGTDSTKYTGLLIPAPVRE